MPDVTGLNIAAVAVLYRPDALVLDNMRAASAQVGRLIAVDNTERPDAEWVASLVADPAVDYLAMGGNLGIAAALNAGVARARELGHGRVLTLDQDSTLSSGMLAALATCAERCPDAGIVAARPVERGAAGVSADVAAPAAPCAGCTPVPTAITSGNLLSIEAWERVGGFDESLFIDSVDHDFCLRLRDAGLGVYECAAATFAHSVGETTTASLVVSAHPSNHSALRRYYITRNRLIVGERHRARHPEFRAQQRSAARRELVKIVLFERDKVAKLRMVWRGWRDYRRGVTGPFPG